MNSKKLQDQALTVMDGYINFHVGSATCSIPYFNNKITRARAALGVNVGKGSTQEIADEVNIIINKNHIDRQNLTSQDLKKLLVQNNLGIDCSGLAFHILEAQNKALGKKSLHQQLIFTQTSSLFGKIAALISPIKNAGVATFAHEKNSYSIKIQDVQPGDIITFLGNKNAGEHDHMLIIYEVEYTNSIPSTLHYVHSIAYPEDGLFDTGVRTGTITINDPMGSLIENQWSEQALYLRSKKDKTDLRRLK